MKTYKTVDEILNGAESPLPLELIPNHMGINLCSVDGVGWNRQPDGQLLDLTIHFKPTMSIDDAYDVEPGEPDSDVSEACVLPAEDN